MWDDWVESFFCFLLLLSTSFPVGIAWRNNSGRIRKKEEERREKENEKKERRLRGWWSPKEWPFNVCRFFQLLSSSLCHSFFILSLSLSFFLSFFLLLRLSFNFVLFSPLSFSDSLIYFGTITITPNPEILFFSFSLSSFPSLSLLPFLLFPFFLFFPKLRSPQAISVNHFMLFLSKLLIGRANKTFLLFSFFLSQFLSSFSFFLPWD